MLCRPIEIYESETESGVVKIYVHWSGAFWTRLVVAEGDKKVSLAYFDREKALALARLPLRRLLVTPGDS